MKTNLRIFAVFSVLIAGSAVRLFADVSFFDGTFNNADWSTKGEVGSFISGTQVSSGGNPGPYMRLQTTNITAERLMFRIHDGAGLGGTAYTYSPASGPISYINGSEDEIAVFNGSGIGVLPALEQSGKFYYPAMAFHLNSGSSWVSYSDANLTAGVFRTYADATDHPDFSITGTPIILGFACYSTTTGFRQAGLDNWSVTIVVPEPSARAFLLLGAGTLSLFYRYRIARR